MATGGPPPRLPGQWGRRLTVTPDSFCLMVRFLLAQNERKPLAARRKVDKATLEAVCRWAALVCTIPGELQGEVPVPEEVLRTELTETFLSGDTGLEIELSSAISEKSVTWQPLTDITKVKELVQARSALADEKVPESSWSVKVQAGKLQAEEFQLLQHKLEYDLKSYRLWKQKLQDREVRLYWQDIHHRENRRAKAAKHVAALFEHDSRAQKLCVCDLGEADALTAAAALKKFQTTVEKSLVGGGPMVPDTVMNRSVGGVENRETVKGHPLTPVCFRKWDSEFKLPPAAPSVNTRKVD